MSVLLHHLLHSPLPACPPSTQYLNGRDFKGTLTSVSKPSAILTALSRKFPRCLWCTCMFYYCALQTHTSKEGGMRGHLITSTVYWIIATTLQTIYKHSSEQGYNPTLRKITPPCIGNPTLSSEVPTPPWGRRLQNNHLMLFSCRYQTSSIVVICSEKKIRCDIRVNCYEGTNSEKGF